MDPCSSDVEAMWAAVTTQEVGRHVLRVKVATLAFDLFDYILSRIWNVHSYRGVESHSMLMLVLNWT